MVRNAGRPCRIIEVMGCGSVVSRRHTYDIDLPRRAPLRTGSPRQEAGIMADESTVPAWTGAGPGPAAARERAYALHDNDPTCRSLGIGLEAAGPGHAQ